MLCTVQLVATRNVHSLSIHQHLTEFPGIAKRSELLHAGNGLPSDRHLVAFLDALL